MQFHTSEQNQNRRIAVDSIKTLIVLTGQDRELGITYPSLKEKVLEPLRADLAFCGVPSESSQPILFQYYWPEAEPVSWLDAAITEGLPLHVLKKYGPIFPQFFGGVLDLPSSENQNWKTGSGFIVQYWRHIAARRLRSLGLLNYEWFAIARSDFLWQVPFFPVENLDSERTYFLNGEKHGGYCDRFILFHRNQFEEVLSVTDRLFEQPEETLELFADSGFLNSELFLKSMWAGSKVEKGAFELPYPGFLIRSIGGTSRWSLGTWSDELGLFVKYPMEELQSKVFSRWISRREHWGNFPLGSPSFRHRLAELEWTIRRALVVAGDQSKWRRKSLRLKRRKLMKKLIVGTKRLLRKLPGRVRH